MKRILSPILIIALMLAVLAGCGDTAGGESPLGSLALTGSMQLDYAD